MLGDRRIRGVLLRPAGKCCELNVSPTNLHVEPPLPNAMVLGGGAFGRGLGYEDGALMNEIGARIRDKQENSLIPSAF